MATRISNPAIQHFDKGTGAQLAGGQLFFFETGTTTPKSVFDDALETTALTNPVILDGNGFEPDIFGTGSYKIVLQNSDDVQQWERDPVDFEVDEGAFSEWLPTISYGVNDIVEGSDGNFYISIIASNLNNDPVASPFAWSQFDLLNRWNTNETYNINDVVRSESSGGVYTSITASNQGNDPTLDTTAINWRMIDNIRIDGNSITSTDTNGNINITPNGTGELLNDGDFIGLAQITQQRFTTSGSGLWTKPTNVKFIILELVGGGGGGGESGIIANRGGGGGGSGAYIREIIDVSIIANSVLSVGAGGAGGVDGVNTTFTISTGIAVGGLFGNEAAQFGTGGDGGTPTGGNANAILIIGGDGHSGSTSTLHSGNGGSSYFGGGGKGRNNGAVGDPGRTKGSGGGGGATGSTTNRIGGAGADGIIIVTEYR